MDKGKEIIKALTIKQPYAWAILNEWKTFEFRSWLPPDDVDYFIIHAGNSPDLAAWKRMRDFFLSDPEYPLNMPEPGELPLGVGLGIAYIRALQPPSENHDWGWHDEFARAMGYSNDLYAWEIEVVQRWTQPIPAKGQQKFWKWKEELPYNWGGFYPMLHITNGWVGWQ